VAQNDRVQETPSNEDLRREREFQRHYLKHRERIYWYIVRKISRSEEAQDLTADVFLKLFEHLDQIKTRGDSAVLAWLYTVARNISVDYLRKTGKRQVRSIDDEEIDAVVKEFDTFVEQALNEYDLQAVYDALEIVDELEREILHLRFEEGLSFSDIALMIGKSEGACKMILYRSIGKIRNELVRRQNETR
jgi:RNA polymerase sigma-70 factor, ECF subfamily